MRPCLLFLPLLAIPIFAQCPSSARLGDISANPAWNGWGVDGSNARFQAGNIAQLPASRISRLKLKWAFGFPGVRSVYGQPSIAAGRVFVAVDTGMVYSLDAATGCMYWSFKAYAGVRTAISIEPVGANRYAAYFGDQTAKAYALDASTGEQLWRVNVDDHRWAHITGAPKVFKGRVYMPVASGEEGHGVEPNYPCCTFRGSVVALDAATGRQIWKTYMIAEEPKRVGKNSNGVQRFAPAGAGVWSSPTIDAKRHALYVGTGDAYIEPAAKTTDSIVALDLETGKMLWSIQDTQNDVWLAGCNGAAHPENCPKSLGSDSDFGASPMLKTLADGRSILVAPQKNGIVWAHDPDRQGAVIWKTALPASPNEVDPKQVWGGAADGQSAYFGLAAGGIVALQLKDGKRKWFTPLSPAAAVSTHPGQDGALTAIPGAVFSGGWDGVLRALSTVDGRVLWKYNTVQDFKTVNGIAAKGGSMGAQGPVAVKGMLFAGSGYFGVRNGMPGNVLLAFSLE